MTVIGEWWLVVGGYLKEEWQSDEGIEVYPFGKIENLIKIIKF